MLLYGARLQVEDIDAAVRDYECVLGRAGTVLADGVVRFPLSCGAVELALGTGPHALRFTPQQPGESSATAHGIDFIVQPGDEVAPLTDDAAAACDDAAVAIDHVVIHTTAPTRAIATWRDHYGLRLALDREFPKRHLRLQFFRSNRITLEYASPLPTPDTAGDDRFFGISYRVANLERQRARLIDSGVLVSDIRQGMRAGTRVATVKSHTCGVPTLMLEVLPAAPESA